MKNTVIVALEKAIADEEATLSRLDHRLQENANERRALEKLRQECAIRVHELREEVFKRSRRAVLEATFDAGRPCPNAERRDHFDRLKDFLARRNAEPGGYVYTIESLGGRISE